MKKAYSSPELKVHGSVEAITLQGQGGPPGGFNGVGNPPVQCPPPGSSKLVSGPDFCNLMSPPDGAIS